MKNITNFKLSKLEKFKKIYVLVSGGFDSTYLLEIINRTFPEKTIPVNCYNPLEKSKTLTEIEKRFDKLIYIKSDEKYDLKKIMIHAFKQIPAAIKLKNEGRYHKKIFGCCRIIKHAMFKKDPRFIEPDTVVISGIKSGDGSQRNAFLSQLPPLIIHISTSS